MANIENLLKETFGDKWEEDSLIKENIVTVYFIPARIIKNWFKEEYPKKKFTHKLYRQYGRGFAYSNKVFIAKETADLELVAHEVGHTKAMNQKKHTLRPGIMNPSGAFRLFCNPFNTLKMFLRHKKIKSV